MLWRVTIPELIYPFYTHSILDSLYSGIYFIWFSLHYSTSLIQYASTYVLFSFTSAASSLFGTLLLFITVF